MRYKRWECLLLYLLVMAINCSEDEYRNSQKVLTAYEVRKQVAANLIASKYDHKMRPQVKTKDNLPVHVSIMFLHFYSIGHEDEAYKTKVEVALRWEDLRVKYPKNASSRMVVLDFSWREKLWFPDLVLENSLRTSIQQVDVPYTYFALYSNSTLLMVTRLTTEIACEIQLQAYPHDRQQCVFKITTMMATEKELSLTWEMGIIGPSIASNLRADKFDLSDGCRIGKSEDVLGKRSCLKGVIVFKRQMGHFILTKYIPSLMMVLVSFGSFCIPVTALAARLILLMASLVSLIIIYEYTVVPSLNMVALNFWMVSCIVFVLSAILEFLFAIKQYGNDLLNPQTKHIGIYADPGKDSKLVSVSEVPVDRLSRKIFPALFILFALIYWIGLVYL